MASRPLHPKVFTRAAKKKNRIFKMIPRMKCLMFLSPEENYEESVPTGARQ